MSFRGSGNRIRIGPGAKLLDCDILMHGSGLVLEIEAGVSVSLEARLRLFDEGSSIRIGRGTTIESARIASLGGASVDIGRDCMLAYEIDIRNSDSHSLLDQETGERLNPERDVHLGDHVWVGGRVALLRGASVAHDSVIGYGSIVTKSFAPHSVLVGAPARVVREGVGWDRRRL